MIDSQPVSFTRALRLMAWLAIRRQANRFQSIRLARKKKDPAKRTGTAPKSSGANIYRIFLLAVVLFNGFNLAAQGLARLAFLASDVQVSPDTIVVSSYTRQKLVETEDALKIVRQDQDVDERQKYEAIWDRYLDSTLQDEVSRESVSDDDGAAQLKRMHDAFEAQGTKAFTATFGGNVFAGSDTWPRTGEAELAFGNSLGLLVLLFAPMFVFLWLGMNNKDLGQVEWSFEWLYGFPVSTRALLASRLFVYSIFNPPVWMFIFPFMIMVYYTAGCGWAAVGLGLAATLYLSVLAGSITMLLEVILRKFLSLGQLKNLQALFTVLGTVCLLLYLASLFSQPLESFLVNKARDLPAFFSWNPLSFYLALGSPLSTPAQAMSVGALMLVIAVAVAAVALFLAEFLIREGLLKSGSPYQGVRRQKSAAPSSAGLLRGVAANEMILLRRDRNILVQVMVSPLIVVAYYFLVNSSMVASATGNFHYAATMAFGIGCYALMSSAMPVLVRENKTLWQLMTFPRELSSILVEKTCVWAVFALIYAGAILLILAHFSRHLHSSAILDSFLALYGVGLYAFIAAGIGIMGTNPLETEVRARMRVEMVYLYMILVAMYAYSIYSPSIWSKFTQIVLSTLLAYALWQKVRDVTPYLLDPAEKPVRSISLADGMMAALAFFVLQGLIGYFLSQWDLPMAMQLVLAYVIAGFLVFVLCLSTFKSQKIPRLWQSVGLARSPENPVPIRQAVLTGLAYGGAAALGAMLYLHVVDLVPAWRTWKQDAEMSAFLRRADNPLWLCGLAVVAAPLFEEFIFRGLVFQGLRRGVGPFWAVLGSAALFALVHPPFSVIPVFGLGVAAAISFQRTGYLLAPILAHATYNACVILFNH